MCNKYKFVLYKVHTNVLVFQSYLTPHNPSLQLLSLFKHVTRVINTFVDAYYEQTIFYHIQVFIIVYVIIYQ